MTITSDSFEKWLISSLEYQQICDEAAKDWHYCLGEAFDAGVSNFYANATACLCNTPFWDSPLNTFQTLLLGCARCVENNKGSSAVSTGLQEKFLNPLCISKTLDLCDFAHEAYNFGVSEEFPVALPFAVLAPAASNDPSLLWPEQAILKTVVREAKATDRGSIFEARDTSASTLADPRVCPIEHLDFGKPTDVEVVACAGKYLPAFIIQSVSRQ